MPSQYISQYHNCYAEGCAKRVHNSYEFCDLHYRILPRENKRAVYFAWRGWQGQRGQEAIRGRAKYLEIRAAAVAALNAAIEEVGDV